jgi:site-specific recombinase XerD
MHSLASLHHVFPSKYNRLHIFCPLPAHPYLPHTGLKFFNNMKTFVILALDTRSPKTDGTSPIVLRITHHQKVTQINTGFYLNPKDWNETTRSIKPSFKGSATRINNLLQKKKSEAIDVIAKLDEQKVLDTLTAVELKKWIEKRPERTSFFAFAQTLIDEMKEANRIGNAKYYKEVISTIKKFNCDRDMTFLDINLAFLNRLETHHLKKGQSYNGLAAKLRAIRAIYNKAIKAKLVDKELYPFAEYSIKTVKTRKRAINPAAIRKIEEKHFEPGHPLFNARNYFLVSLYLRGMSFTDLAHLKMENIIDGRIQYERKKTGMQYDIKITEATQAILTFYTAKKGKDEFVFPIIRSSDIEEQYRQVEWARRRFNKKLKLLAIECEIQENLTSYVSRHSFATIAKNLGHPTASISDMLGHTNIKTTEIYLDSLQSDLLDDLHEQIIKKI